MQVVHFGDRDAKGVLEGHLVVADQGGAKLSYEPWGAVHAPHGQVLRSGQAVQHDHSGGTHVDRVLVCGAHTLRLDGRLRHPAEAHLPVGVLLEVLAGRDREDLPPAGERGRGSMQRDSHK